MDKNTKQAVIWLTAWMILLISSMSIKEAIIGWMLLILGTALMLMYAWADDKLEKARKNERKKVIDGARRIEKAYQVR